MRIPVFLHNANPAVDKPFCNRSRNWVATRIDAGVMMLLAGGKSAQYTSDRAGFVDAPAPRSESEVGYDRTVSHGRNLVWAPCGLTWQMKPTYGSMSRHFGRTPGGMNFAPNKSTSPREHSAGV